MAIESEPIDAVTELVENSMALQDSGLRSGDSEGPLDLYDEIECMKQMGLPAAFGSKQSKAKTKPKRKESKAGRSTELPAKKQKTEAKALDRFKQRKLLLFDRWPQFGDDIVIDDQMYYSITPEKIAKRIANHCKNKVDYTLLLDGFCGVGGNLIQFAVQNSNAFIVGIDCCFERVRSARKIAQVYGVEHRCDFICGDFFRVAPSLAIKPDIVFLSPPWGGTNYRSKKTFLLKDLPVDGNRVFETSKQLTDNIAFYLPCNQDLDDLDSLNEFYTVDANVFPRFGLTLNVFFGKLINPHDVRPLKQTASLVPPAVCFSEELSPISAAPDSFSALSSPANCNTPHIDAGEASSKDGTVHSEIPKGGHPNVRTANRSDRTLRSQTKKNVLKSDRKNIFKRAKKILIAQVLREKCCLM